jgi:hypothetical protein
MVRVDGCLTFDMTVKIHPFVVIISSHGQDFFGVFLTDNDLI